MIDLAKIVKKKGCEVRLTPSKSRLSRILTNCGFAKFLKLQSIETDESVEFEVPSRIDMVSYIRTRVADFARSMPFTHDDIEDIKLAVGEASTNAIRHGASPECCNVDVRLEKHLGEMKIHISDKGCGFDPDNVSAPAVDSFAESGRGIIFMKALMDEVKFCMCNPGTSVELTKKFH